MPIVKGNLCCFRIEAPIYFPPLYSHRLCGQQKESWVNWIRDPPESHAQYLLHFVPTCTEPGDPMQPSTAQFCLKSYEVMNDDRKLSHFYNTLRFGNGKQDLGRNLEIEGEKFSWRLKLYICVTSH